MSRAKLLEAMHHGPWVIYRFLVIWCLSALLYGITISGAVAVEYTYYRIMPVTHWVKYESVSPVEPVRAYREITFVSRSEIVRMHDTEWSDVLFCDLKDGYGRRNHVSQKTNRDGNPPRPMKDVVWTFSRLAPRSGSECDLVSTITANLPYGIKKSKIIHGKMFVVQ